MQHSVRLYETHSHTPLCRHAAGDPVEYARVARQRGLCGLVVTCHNPMPNGFSAGVRMRMDEFDEYVSLVVRTRQQMKGLVDVLLGLEADYFPGYEDWLRQQLSSAEFHYVLGSVHPQIPEFKARFGKDGTIAFQRAYFRMLVEAAETGLFDCLAHPDLVKNETWREWDVERIMPDICDALDRIEATGVAMEINTSGVNKVIPEMNPFPEMLREMCQRSIPIVIGADAHEPGRAGDGFADALDLAEAAGYTHVSNFVARERREIAIGDARETLRSAPIEAGTN